MLFVRLSTVKVFYQIRDFQIMTMHPRTTSDLLGLAFLDTPSYRDDIISYTDWITVGKKKTGGGDIFLFFIFIF